MSDSFSRRAALAGALAALPAIAGAASLGAPPTPSAAVALAIAAHKAAQAALDAVPSGDEDAFAEASDLETEALQTVAETPCENDADFFVKAAYLIEREREAWGTELSESASFGLLALATELHMEGRPC